MGLAKLLALLAHKSLYFPKVSTLLVDDPFEASQTTRTKQEAMKVANDTAAREAFFGTEIPQNAAQLIAANMARIYPEHFFVSCWHESEYESAALWKVYANIHEGVAVRTTVGRLTSCFDLSTFERSLYLGRVKYMDFDKEFGRLGNVIAPVFWKRKSFEYEQEVRVAYWLPFYPGDPVTPEEAERKGISFPVNVDLLVQKVLVSPYAQPWLAWVVEATVRAMGCNAPVRRSPLLDVQ
jgi:hypothetical protein